MLNLLKAKWVFFGLEAPILSWFIVIVLVLFMVGYWLKMYFGVFRPISKRIGLAKQKLAHMPKPNEMSNRTGLGAQSYDEVRSIFEQNEILKSCWQGFSKHLIRRSREGSDFFWSGESAAESFGESALIGTRLNLTLCQALPGIITGIGLLFTFVAILIALLDVRLVNNRVQGIELLIQGLSGKFVSSIAALFLATIHLFIEKSAFHRLRNNCQQLVKTLDGLFPRLTLAHLFAEVRAQVAEQTNVIRTFNSNLAPALKASITEGVGPTLERMVVSIEALNQLLRQNEAQKQESITGSIEKLLKDLSDSLTGSITRMSDSFSNNLVGSAQTQFSEMRSSLSSTAALLNGMNDQFEGLTSRLENMMAQMSERLKSNAEVTTGAAKEILKQAGDWSDRSATQIEEMLKQHQQQVASVEKLRDAFTSALSNFTLAIERHSGMIRGLGETADRITKTVAAADQTMLGTQAAQKSLEQVATQTRIQAEHLAKANERQEEIWRTLQSNLTRYTEAFTLVEKTAKSLLSEINDHLNNYTRTTHNGFQQLVEMADNHFSNATNKLGASVEELDEVLNDLADTLAKTRYNGTR